MLPIEKIVIIEDINDSHDDIYTFYCKECKTLCEACVESDGNIYISKLCECGLINIHRQHLQRILTAHHLLNEYISRKSRKNLRRYEKILAE